MNKILRLALLNFAVVTQIGAMAGRLQRLASPTGRALRHIRQNSTIIDHGQIARDAEQAAKRLAREKFKNDIAIIEQQRQEVLRAEREALGDNLRQKTSVTLAELDAAQIADRNASYKDVFATETRPWKMDSVESHPTDVFNAMEREGWSSVKSGYKQDAGLVQDNAKYNEVLEQIHANTEAVRNRDLGLLNARDIHIRLQEERAAEAAKRADTAELQRLNNNAFRGLGGKLTSRAAARDAQLLQESKGAWKDIASENQLLREQGAREAVNSGIESLSNANQIAGGILAAGAMGSAVSVMGQIARENTALEQLTPIEQAVIQGRNVDKILENAKAGLQAAMASGAEIAEVQGWRDAVDSSQRDLYEVLARIGEILANELNTELNDDEVITPQDAVAMNKMAQEANEKLNSRTRAWKNRVLNAGYAIKRDSSAVTSSIGNGFKSVWRGTGNLLGRGWQGLSGLFSWRKNKTQQAPINQPV